MKTRLGVALQIVTGLLVIVSGWLAWHNPHPTAASALVLGDVAATHFSYVDYAKTGGGGKLNDLPHPANRYAGT